MYCSTGRLRKGTRNKGKLSRDPCPRPLPACGFVPSLFPAYIGSVFSFPFFFGFWFLVLLEGWEEGGDGHGLD